MEYNGYKLPDWFTSTIKKEPGQTDDYWDYKSSLNNMGNTGSDLATITLKDAEKTLYMLLVKDKDAVDVDEGGGSSIEGDWHIRESQLTRRVDTGIPNPKTLDLHEFEVKWGDCLNARGIRY